MATHSSILAWRIPWTGEPGGLQSMGWQRVRHDWKHLACIPVSCNYFDESLWVVTSQKLFKGILILPIFLNNSLVSHITLVWLLHIFSVKESESESQWYSTVCNLMDYTLHGILQAKNTGVGSLSLLQRIFPTQGLNPGLPHFRQIRDQLSYQGSLYSLCI